MKNNLLKILMDMIPVILGIFIGLFLNEWREGRNEVKFRDQVLFSISEEMKENKIELESLIIEHKNAIDTIGKYLEEEHISIGMILSKIEGVRAPTIKNASSKSIMNSNIELFDYKLISTLTSIDESKIGLNMLISKMVDFIYDNIESEEYMKKQIFQMSIGDILHSETQLLEAHEEYFLSNLTRN